MPKTKRENPLDWEGAAKRTLTTSLNRLDDLAQSTEDPKLLESIIKTVSDVVGASVFGVRGRRAQSELGAGGGDDE